ncbi:MAG TPA: hypothetical protein VF897_04725, partial [Roseiflexaceae bacterium]
MSTSHERLSAFHHSYAKRGLFVWLIAALVLTAWVHPSTASNTDQNLLACTRVPNSFGRMFGQLPAASWPAADVDLLASKVMAEEET